MGTLTKTKPYSKIKNLKSTIIYRYNMSYIQYLSNKNFLIEFLKDVSNIIDFKFCGNKLYWYNN